MIPSLILYTYLTNPDGKRFNKDLIITLHNLTITNSFNYRLSLPYSHHDLYIYHNDTEFCITDLSDPIEFASNYIDRFEWFIRVPYCRVTLDNLEQRFPDIGLSTLECSVIY